MSEIRTHTCSSDRYWLHIANQMTIRSRPGLKRIWKFLIECTFVILIRDRHLERGMVFLGARKKLTHKFIIRLFFFAWKIGKNIQILSILQGQIWFCILQVKHFFTNNPLSPYRINGHCLLIQALKFQVFQIDVYNYLYIFTQFCYIYLLFLMKF